MPVYKRHRLVHLHIPKTGGTAIERQFDRLGDLVWGLESWLGQEYRENRWYEYQHLTAAELQSLSNGEYRSWETFAVVRSPYERLISDFRWRVQLNLNNPDAPVASFGSFAEFIKAIPADIDEDWSDHIIGADQSTANFLIHTRPQHHYVSVDRDLDPSIELLRFETLRGDIERLFSRWNIENQAIANTTRYRIADFYTAETLQLVNEGYARDFELFSYEKILPTDRRFRPSGASGSPTVDEGHELPAARIPQADPAPLGSQPKHRIAILVIAALNQPLYLHYIRTYWTEMINYTNAATSHIDVFLLIENGTAIDVFSHIADNVIEDPFTDLNQLCEARFRSPGVPGILSKTIHALDVLQGGYDLFFRTNLSSMVRLTAFDDFVQSRDQICYSGGLVWGDALRDNLVRYNRVGPGRSVESLDELDAFVGNTFVSGSGYFLNVDEARSLVERRDQLRYDLPDDVAVGLMLDRHEVLDRFSLVLRPNEPVGRMIQRIRASPAGHIRLQHFPLEIAEALWRDL